MPHLKPISDFERGLLEALGETAAEHQRQVMEAQRPTWAKSPRKKAHASSHETSRRDLNKTYFSKFDLDDKKTSTEIVEALVPPALLADAYILFLRHQTCKNCRRTYTVQDTPQLFLRERYAKKDPNNTYIYTPVKSITHGNLPRLVQSVLVTSPVCLACFSEAVCQKVEPESPASFPPAGTVSSTLMEELETTTPEPLLEASSSSESPLSSTATSSELKADGYSSETPPKSSFPLLPTLIVGTESESSNSAQSAVAPSGPSPTDSPLPAGV